MRVLPVPAGTDLGTMEWRICHATPDYEISEYGHVCRRTLGRGTYPGKILSFCWHSAGYPRFKLTIGGRHHHFEAHRLVAGAFLPAPPPGCDEVAHLDGDPASNHFSNLCWKTHQQNEADKIVHGTAPTGERNGAAKLTAEAVSRIRARRAEGLSLSKIGAEFGIAFQTVSKIVNGQRWRHIHESA